MSDSVIEHASDTAFAVAHHRVLSALADATAQPFLVLT